MALAEPVVGTLQTLPQKLKASKKLHTIEGTALRKENVGNVQYFSPSLTIALHVASICVQLLFMFMLNLHVNSNISRQDD